MKGLYLMSLFCLGVGSVGALELEYGGMLNDSVLDANGIRGMNSMAISPDGNHLYVTAYETHTLAWFTRDKDYGTLVYSGKIRQGDNFWDGNKWITVEGLWKPNKVVISLNGKYLYVVSELESKPLSWYSRNDVTGELTYGGGTSQGFIGIQSGNSRVYSASSIVLHPADYYLYAVSSLDDGLLWFSTDPGTGALTFLDSIHNNDNGITTLEGVDQLAIAWNGEQVYVTSTFSKAVSWFEVNKTTGALTYRNSWVETKDPDLYYPTSMALTLNSGDLYIASINEGDIKHFDRVPQNGDLTYLGDTHLEDAILGISSPLGIVLSPDERTAIVSAHYDSTLILFDRNPDTGTLTYGGYFQQGLAGVSGLDFPRALAISSGPEYYLYVASGEFRAFVSPVNHLSWFRLNSDSKSIFINSPDGSEQWPVGSRQIILWTTTGLLDSINIELNTGWGWNPVAENIPDSGYYEWVVPDKISPVCKIRVSEAPDGIPFDTSYEYFSIVAANPIVQNPMPDFKINRLGQNRPNPFSQLTKINYSLKSNETVVLEIVNVKSEVIRSLVHEGKSAGSYTVEWNGQDQNGRDVPNGIYFYRLRLNRFKEVKTLLLFK